MISVKIEGVEVDANKIAFKSTKIKKSTKKKRNLTISLYYTASETVPLEGMDIEVYEGVDLRFGGVIKTSAPVAIDRSIGVNSLNMYKVTSDGYNSIPQRRTISASYTDKKAGDIVTDIITNILSQEGITTGTIEDGATFDYYDGVYKSTKEILDDMADASGFSWNINDQKQIDFIKDSTIVISSDTIKEDDADHFDFMPKRTLAKFRNKQFVEGATLDDGTVVRYTAEDSANIATRAALENNSGVYGNVFRDSNIQSVADAEVVAKELLRRYMAPASISVKSYRSFNEGEVIKVTYPKFKIATDTQYLITDKTEVRDQDRWLYSYKLEARSFTDYTAKSKSDSVDFFNRISKASYNSSGGGGGSSAKETTIHQSKNDNFDTLGNIASKVMGVNVKCTLNTRVAFMAEITMSDIEVDSDVVLEARVNGQLQRSSITWVDGKVGGIYRTQTAQIVGNYDSVEPVTKSFEIYAKTSGSPINILPGNARMTLIVHDGEAEKIPDWVPPSSDSWDYDYNTPESFGINQTGILYLTSRANDMYAIATNSLVHFIMKSDTVAQNWANDSGDFIEFGGFKPSSIQAPVIIGDYMYMFAYYNVTIKTVRYDLINKVFAFVEPHTKQWFYPIAKEDGTGFWATDNDNVIGYDIQSDTWTVTPVATNSRKFIGSYNGLYYMTYSYGIDSWNGVASAYTQVLPYDGASYGPGRAVFVADKLYRMHLLSLPQQNPRSYLTWDVGDTDWDYATKLAGYDPSYPLAITTVHINGVIYCVISGQKTITRYYI